MSTLDADPSLPLLFEPSEWQYLNEGVANVVLVQRTPSSDCASRAGPPCVLRIAKPLSVMQQHSTDLDELFAASIGRSFVAIGKPCTVSVDLLAHQLRAAENLNLRLAKRVRAFPASSVNASSAVRCHAVLMRDLNSAISSDELEMLSIPRAVLSAHCAVEIKPKCFVHPISPFISLNNAIKYKVCRYQMHQVTKSLADGLSNVSEYCPFDLTSGDPIRVLQSLRALQANPQNNFRISNTSNFNSFESVIAAWCCTSSLGGLVFSRLRAIQYLDAWDIEVVQHIPALIRKLDQQSDIDFAQLDKDSWLADLNDLIMFNEDLHAGTCRCFCCNPSEVSCEQSDLQFWCRHASVGLSQSGNEAIQKLCLQSTERDLYSMSAALTFLESLSRSDLLTIVFNFLIATTAKDVSIILSISEVHGDDGGPVDQSNADSKLPQCVRVATQHCDARADTLPMASLGLFSDSSHHRSWAIRAALIDIDQKSPAKIPEYARLDQEIVSNFLSALALR